MASKSKKRRRVLGASCILAALIIAGSSFAWFTSKDEVTNRLTASSDYGVSIVESYIPPKQWVPGQTIDKDVYAVNTGNIPAFVKEDVSGKLTVEYENTVGSYDPALGYTYVKLTTDEVALAKAGGYLVWNDAGAENGAVGTDYTPDAAAKGNYVFRRAIEDNDPLATNNEKYALEGFYFDGTDYYKILIANYHTGSEDHNRTPVAVTADGELSADPDIMYVVSDTVTGEPVALYYEETVDGTKRLVATYSLDPSAAVNYDQAALDARHAVEVANAQGDYEIAKYKQDVAQKEYDLIKDLITERNTLVSKAKDYKDKADAADAAATGTGGMSDKKAAVAAVTAGTLDLTGKAPYADRVLKTTDAGYTATGTAHDAYPTEVKSAILAFENKYNAIFDTSSTGTGYQKSVLDAFTTLQNAVGSDADDATLDGYITALQNAYSTLDTESENLYMAYYDIINSTTSSGLALDPAGLSAFKKKLGDASEADSYMRQVDDYKTKMNELINKVKAFETARQASQSADQARDQAFTQFNTAVGQYQTNVSSKISTFKNDVQALQTAFDATNNQTGGGSGYDGSDVYNTAVDETGSDGFLTKVKANTDYYLDSFDTAADYDSTVVDNPSTPAVDEAAANKTAAAGLGALTPLTATAPTESTFKLNLDNSGKSLTTLKSEATAAKRKWDNLVSASTTAPTANDIKIYINLDENVDTNWTRDPATAVDAATAKEVISFYLNNILDEGETSAKLIDSVELDAATQNVFKNLTFDLDIGLDSAQITYANDQQTITTDVVKTNNDFTLKPTANTYSSLDDTLAWATPTP